jgi:hypothetical protein
LSTPPEETPSQTVATNGGQNIPVGTSIFTDGGFTPTGGSGAGGPSSGGGGSTGGGGTGGGGSTGGGGGIIINPPPADPNPPECSSADLNIRFTPEEINRLNVLKTRFFVIAETVNTDADVATELSNYDTFKTKSKKITELYDYCINSPVYKNAQPTVVASQPYGTTLAGTNGAINYRVPTPFWHDINKDNQAFVHQGSNWMGIFSDPDLVFPERSVEHALRLNLW